MTAIFRKLRRKRRLSTELHSRWGDVSITYPTEGSWSQWDQPTGFVANTTDARSEESHRYSSGDSQGTVPRPPPDSLHPRGRGSGEETSEDLGTIPTGYYNAKLRYPPRKRKHSDSDHGTGDTGHSVWRRDSDGRSESEEDSSTPERGRHQTEFTTHNAAEGTGSPQRAPRSPPLSITSRMRRHSQQSNTTDPTASMPGTASSQSTSFAASSASGPSAPDDPRLVYNAAYQEKKQQLRSKYHEPEPVMIQELVPSYDELYG